MEAIAKSAHVGDVQPGQPENIRRGLKAFEVLLFATIVFDASFYIAETTHVYLHDFTALAVLVIGLSVRRAPRPRQGNARWELTPILLFLLLIANTVIAAALTYDFAPALRGTSATIELKLFAFEVGNGLRILAELLVWCWTLQRLRPNHSDVRQLLSVALWAIVTFVLISGLAIVTGLETHQVTSTFDLLTMVGVPLAVAFIFVGGRTPTNLARFVLVTPATLLLYSRTALLGIGITGALVIASVKGRRLLLSALAAMALTLFVAIAPTSTATRLDSILNPSLVPYTIPTRLAIWDDALHIWQLSPIVGVGYHNYGLYSQVTEIKDEVGADVAGVFSSRIKQAHNDFLSMLVETGAVGLIVYVLFWIGTLRKGWRLLTQERARDRTLYAFMFGLPLSIFILSLTGEFLIPRTPAWMPAAIVWWLIIASIFTLSEQAEEN